MANRLRLSADWKRIARKAWSFRLLAVAAVLTACEVALPFFGADLPPAMFAVLSGLAIVGAMVARLVAQKEFER